MWKRAHIWNLGKQIKLFRSYVVWKRLYFSIRFLRLINLQRNVERNSQDLVRSCSCWSWRSTSRSGRIVALVVVSHTNEHTAQVPSPAPLYCNATCVS